MIGRKIIFQKTLKDKVKFEGIGIHFGQKAIVILHPWNKGIAFYINKEIIPLNPCIIGASPGFTFLKKGNRVIYTLEHLLSALHGLEIDNILIEVIGNEIPSLDGSAQKFVDEFEKVGFENLGKEKKYFTIEEEFEISEKESYIKLKPSSNFRIHYFFEPKRPLPNLISKSYFIYEHSVENFKNLIAPCRTFCFKEDIKKIKKMGLGKGGNLDNTLVIDKKNTLNQPRNFYEPIGHKVLDLIGDLYTLGCFIKAQIEAKNTYHILNISLVKRLYTFFDRKIAKNDKR